MLSFNTLLAAAVLATSVQAHTYLITPQSRLSITKNIGTSTEDGTGNGAGLCHLGDGTQTCCTSTTMGGSMKTYQRGTEIPTAWWRNNHVGGFVRYSIVPIAQSGSQDAFDAAENMLNYECNQVGCSATYGGSSPNNWNGGDSAGSKGWSNACSGAFKIPYHLKDGQYTVQWVWFGQGNGNQANSPFQACIDLNISGGPTGSPLKCPLWKGGDLSEAGDNVCTFVSVNNPSYQGVCKDANACQGSYQVGIPKGLQECVAGNAPSTFPLAMVTSSSGVPNTFDSYSPDGSAVSSGGSSSSSSSNSTSSSSSSSGSSSSNSGSSSGGSLTVQTTKKKCSAGSKKRRHYGRRSHVRREGLEFAYDH